MRRILACLALACLAACAAAPEATPGIGDGGIVGTGARMECDRQTREECKREGIR